VNEGKDIGVGGGGVGRGDGLVGQGGDLVEETALVVGHDELKAAGAELDGGAPRRETLLHPSVELVEPTEDLVEGKLEEGIRSEVPKSMDLMKASRPRGLVSAIDDNALLP
jgi:hypothetical protein